MKKPTLKISIAASLFSGTVFGALACWYILNNMDRSEHQSGFYDGLIPPVTVVESQKKVSILVVVKDLKAGNYFNDLIVRNSLIPQDYYASYYALSRDYKDKIKGKRLNTDLRAGDPILFDFVDEQ